MTSFKIMGYGWEDIQRAQQGGRISRATIDTSKPGDFGADPIGGGMYRMVPSGDVVNSAERNARLGSN